jgi:capsular exopolysaccharide synthesis family protein
MGLVSIDPVRLLRRHYPLLIGAAIAGAAIGLVSHFALMRVYPRYDATAVFRCDPPVASPLDSGQGMESQDATARFMGTQVAMMTADEVLAAALKDPDLERSDWAKQFYVSGRLNTPKAMQELTKDLSARVRSSTNLITLSITWRKAPDTATVVNAVARAYMQDLDRMNKSESAGKRDALNARMRAIGTEKERIISARDRLLQDSKITDLETAGQSENMQLANIAESLVKIESGMAAVQSMQQKYQDLLKNVGTPVYPDELISATREDPIIRQSESEISALKIEERSQLARGFGSNHPTLISLRQRIDASERELEARRDEILRKMFDARLDQFRSELAAMEMQKQELETKRDVANTRKEDVVRSLVKIRQFNSELETLAREEGELSIAIKNADQLANSRVYDRVRVLRWAQTPDRVSFPKIQILVPLGIVLFTGLAGGILVLRELLDQRVRGPADLAVIPRLNILGMIPDVSEDPSRPKAIETAFRDTPGGVVTESFRLIRNPLVKKMDQGGRRSLVVMGGMPGSGATTVVCNLGIACAGSGERVLIIDANLRRPAVHKALGLPESPGLGDILAGQATLDAAAQQTGVENLSILPAGTLANRAVPERLSSEAMGRLISEASTKYDRVIIDVPPAIVSGDGMAIANRADSVALVVRAMNEKRGLVNRLRAQLSETHAEMLGVIVNAVRSSAGGYFKRNIQATHAYQSQTK